MINYPSSLLFPRLLSCTLFSSSLLFPSLPSLLFSRLQLCTDPHIRDDGAAKSNISSRTSTPTLAGDAVTLSSPFESQLKSASLLLDGCEGAVSDSRVARINNDNVIISTDGNVNVKGNTSASVSEAISGTDSNRYAPHSSSSSSSTTQHPSMSTSVTSTVPTTVPTPAAQLTENCVGTSPVSSMPSSASKIMQAQETFPEKSPVQSLCSVSDLDNGPGQGLVQGPGVMVTVSDLWDHPSKPHSLIFFLRVPAEGREGGSDRATDKRWEVELEFEFDLLTDDARSIVVEMKECEELSAVRIDVEHITRVFAPFVLAANRHLALSPTQASSSGLAKAVIVEVRMM